MPYSRWMSLQWYPGHMTSQDVMIEVLDSRLPKASSNPLIAEVRGTKPVVKVLTKSDLADPAVTRAWVAYLEGEPGVKAFAATTKQPQVTRKRIAELCRQRQAGGDEGATGRPSPRRDGAHR